MNDDNTNRGALGDEAFAELDRNLVALLADPSTWVEPPHELGDRVVAAVRSEADLGASEPLGTGTPASGSLSRRTWMRPALLGAAAAVVFLFGGIVVLSALSGGVEDTDTFTADLTPTGLIADVGGAIDVTTFDSGVRIDLDSPGLPRRDDGSFYEGWVKTADGSLFAVGTFHDGDDVTLWAGVELDRIELFTITLETAAGPDDLRQGSSGEVVLRTDIRP